MIVDERNKTIKPKHFEIWYAYVPNVERSVKSSKQYGYRPVLIVSNDKFNEYSNQVNIYPFSSKIQKWSPVHVLVTPDDINGLEEESILLCESPDSIPQSCLICKKGEIRDLSTLREIKNAIGLQNPLIAKM